MNSKAPQFNPSFKDTMDRTFADVCRAVDSAYIHCYDSHIERDLSCDGCPWKNPNYPNPGETPCRVMALIGMGFVIASDTVQSEKIEVEEAEGLK